MATPGKTSTKIDEISRRKLDLLTDPKPSDERNQNAMLATMMDDIVDRVESGKTTQVAIADAEAAREAGVISWGSENGAVIGTMVDGTNVAVRY